VGFEPTVRPFESGRGVLNAGERMVPRGALSFEDRQDTIINRG
jgi:hypothetical protein